MLLSLLDFNASFTSNVSSAKNCSNSFRYLGHQRSRRGAHRSTQLHRRRGKSAISIKMLSYCTRIAARPPLSQPDSRRSAVTITHGPNDEFPLQGCTREHLLEDAVWGLPHAAVTTNHEQQANLEPCTPALTCYSHSPTLMQSARTETSRFPMTRTAPRFAPACQQAHQRSGRPDQT